MITLPVFRLPDIIPPGELTAWRSSIVPPKGTVPPKVMEFIDGLASTLPEFQQFQQYQDYITGRELLLCGQKVWGKEKVQPAKIYAMNVPKCMAVDRRSTMITIFLRKGKNGLIDYVKVQLKGHSLERILYHLHVNIFNEQDPRAGKEFTEMMDKIQAEKKQPKAA
jgi:hypothetical protein